MNRIADCYYMIPNYPLAIEYYDKVIDFGSVDADYALYQKGFALGLTNEYKNKVNVLSALISRFPTSKYVPGAFFERGRAHVVLKNSSLGEADFNSVINNYPNSPFVPRAMVQLGLLYFNTGENQKAITEFKKVIEINGSMAKEADAEFAIIQKIKKAMPESINGKRIAIIKQISRADVAALFIEELKIDELLDKRAPKKSDASLKGPETNSQTGEHVKDIRVTDIDDHVLRADMQAAINIGIRGLQPFPDNKFRPDQIITRAEYAIMIEDILIKITGENELATRYIDRSSPFPDLHNDLPYFNAVMTCASRGIMTANDMRTGEFDPFGPISGADALLGIRALKTQL